MVAGAHGRLLLPNKGALTLVVGAGPLNNFAYGEIRVIFSCLSYHPVSGWRMNWRGVGLESGWLGRGKQSRPEHRWSQ